MSVDNVNARAAKTCILGWLAGLAYYNWFAQQPPHLSLWLHVVLAFVGMFAAAILIGGALAFVAGLIAKIATGSRTSSLEYFMWTVFIGPALSFSAAGFLLQALSS